MSVSQSKIESKLVLGGLVFIFHCGDDLLLSELAPNYSSFFSLSSPLDVNCCFHFDRIDTNFLAENWSHAKPIFQSPVWKLLKLETCYYTVRFSSSPSKPFWVARSDFVFADATIFYDPKLNKENFQRKLLVESILSGLGNLVLLHYLSGQGLGVTLHTAALHIGNRIWLFSGCSGAGKSTFSRLWLDRTDAHVVNDDRMIVRRNESGPGFTAYGTPWPGELGIALNESAPLGGICFLRQSAQTEIRPITPQQALPQLLPLASIPWYEQDLVPPALDFCDRLLAGVPLYELHFRPDHSAVEAVLQLAG